MSAIILNNEIVHYEVLGRGRPLVFLHGWVGSWRYWIPAMQAASVSYRAYALDLWGFGDTAKNTSLYNIEEQVDLLDQFLQEQGISKIALVGHGLGAVTGLLFAVRCPSLVDRLMLVGLPDRKSATHHRLHSAPPQELADWLLGRAELAEAARLETLKTDPLAVQHSLASMLHIDLAHLPFRLGTPCLMVYGQNDPACAPPPEPATLPEHLHQVTFDQSGHFPMLDEPSKFNRLMADFLALSSGTSPRQLQVKAEWKRRVR